LLRNRLRAPPAASSGPLPATRTLIVRPTPRRRGVVIGACLFPARGPPPVRDRNGPTHAAPAPKTVVPESFPWGPGAKSRAPRSVMRALPPSSRARRPFPARRIRPWDKPSSADWAPTSRFQPPNPPPVIGAHPSFSSQPPLAAGRPRPFLRPSRISPPARIRGWSNTHGPSTHPPLPKHPLDPRSPLSCPKPPPYAIRPWFADAISPIFRQMGPSPQPRPRSLTTIGPFRQSPGERSAPPARNHRRRPGHRSGPPAPRPGSLGGGPCLPGGKATAPPPSGPYSSRAGGGLKIVLRTCCSIRSFVPPFRPRAKGAGLLNTTPPAPFLTSC